MLTPPSPSRRWFLRGLIATAVAPAIVRADSLMRIVPRETAVVIMQGPQWADSVFTFSSDELALTGEEFAVRVCRPVARFVVAAIDAGGSAAGMRIGDMFTIEGALASDPATHEHRRPRQSATRAQEER